jgi:uncharacterized membrane protein
MVALSSAHPLARPGAPRLETLSSGDLRWALSQGWRDFMERRGDLLILAFIYPVVGLLASALAVRGSLFPLVFPLAAGLSILGPAVASGFYEIARRREAGLDADWRHFLDPFSGRRAPVMAILTVALAALAGVWIAAAWGIYELTLGRLGPMTLAGFVGALFTTAEGWTMIVVGNLVGLAFAAAALAIGLVSFPLVVDGRAAGPLDALTVSVEAFAQQPRAVAQWGLTVAAILVVASIPLFIGLAWAVPALGYATWRLYTRLVPR